MRVLKDVIESILPDGTVYPKPTGRAQSHVQAPIWPGDVFAVAAYLLDKSGAYQRVVSMPDSESDGKPKNKDNGTNVPVSSLFITPKMRKEASRLGKLWRETTPDENKGKAPDEINKLWRALWKQNGEPLVCHVNQRDRAPQWWIDAAMLMMVADEASVDVGYPILGKNDEINWIRQMAAEAALDTSDDLSKDISESWSYNWTFLTDESVCCVVPKSSAPEVGCTLRALSHNLALAPGIGEARAHWRTTGSTENFDAEALNLLLIPFPFRISPKCFQHAEASGRPDVFHVKQLWLSAERKTQFKDFLKKCLQEAQTEVQKVHGIVLPEMALNPEYYDLVREFIADRGIPLLISGVNSGKQENLVRTDIKWREETKKYFGVIRNKHHRWRLDRSQIEQYALADTLDPSQAWWERLRVSERSIEVVALSPRSTFTTLICEDLARIDPCQRLIRAIGPSLIIALLMDGPQLNRRWPARYATVLAEDPGASVLTFTSLGLIRRSEDAHDFEKNRVVGLWRERSGHEKMLKLPSDGGALLLTLRGRPRTVRTMDGREGPQRTEWSLVSRYPISIGKGDAKDWILNGQGATN